LAPPGEYEEVVCGGGGGGDAMRAFATAAVAARFWRRCFCRLGFSPARDATD